MKSSLSCAKLQVKKSPIHGYGVFADQDIKPGAIIEECYVLLTEIKDLNFSDYYFRVGGELCLVLGWGSIYNHSDHPNASFSFDKASFLCTFTATRLIKRGEEIFISYGRDWFGSREMSHKELTVWYKARRLMLLLGRFALIASALFFLMK